PSLHEVVCVAGDGVVNERNLSIDFRILHEAKLVFDGSFQGDVTEPVDATENRSRVSGPLCRNEEPAVTTRTARRSAQCEVERILAGALRGVLIDVDQLLGGAQNGEGKAVDHDHIVPLWRRRSGGLEGTNPVEDLRSRGRVDDIVEDTADLYGGRLGQLLLSRSAFLFRHRAGLVRFLFLLPAVLVEANFVGIAGQCRRINDRGICFSLSCAGAYAHDMSFARGFAALDLLFLDVGSAGERTYLSRHGRYTCDRALLEFGR